MGSSEPSPEVTPGAAPEPAFVPWHRRAWRLALTILVNRTERRLRAGWRIAAQTAALGLVAGALAVGLRLAVTLGEDLLLGLVDSRIAAVAWYAAALLTTISITATVWLARRMLDRRPFLSLGLRLDGHMAPDLVFGFVAAAVMQAAVFAIHLAAGWIVEPRFAWEMSSPGEVVLGLVSMTFLFALVGWHEELLARGYWLQNLADGLGLRWGVALSSLAFSAGHLWNPHAGWIPFAGIVCAGLFLAFAYVRTGQLWLAIGLHWGWNLFEGPVFGFPVSGLGLPGVLDFRVSGPEIFTGGAFGPEAGLVQFPAFALGVALILLYTRRRASPSAAPPASEQVGEGPAGPIGL